jgi:hypothetical protein
MIEVSLKKGEGKIKERDIPRCCRLKRVDDGPLLAQSLASCCTAFSVAGKAGEKLHDEQGS